MSVLLPVLRKEVELWMEHRWEKLRSTQKEWLNEGTNAPFLKEFIQLNDIENDEQRQKWIRGNSGIVVIFMMRSKLFPLVVNYIKSFPENIKWYDDS